MKTDELLRISNQLIAQGAELEEAVSRLTEACNKALETIEAAQSSLEHQLKDFLTNTVDTKETHEGENSSTEGRLPLSPDIPDSHQRNTEMLHPLLRKTFDSIVHVPPLTDEDKETLKSIENEALRNIRGKGKNE